MEESAGTSSRSKQIGRKCVICGIYQSEAPSSKKYHSFPLKPDLSEKWALASGKKWVIEASIHSRNSRFRICEDHFLLSDYTTAGKTRLKANAVPIELGEISALTSMQKSLKEKLQGAGTISFSTSEEGIEASTSSIIDDAPSPLLPSPSYFQDAGSSMTSTIEASSSPMVQSLPVLASTPKSHTPKSHGVKSRRKLLLTPKTRKIKVLSTKLYYLKKKLASYSCVGKPRRYVLNTIKNLVSPTIYNFIASQMKMSSVSKYGRRWNVQDKNLALSLYLASPRTYKALCKIFHMPSKTTLMKCVSGIKMAAGFSEAILRGMQLVVAKFKPADKMCIISFDEMKLKAGLSYNSSSDIIEGFESYGSFTVQNPKISTHALVFMVRGLCKKWKQVFGYFFTNEATPSHILKHLVNEALSKLKGCGLEPIAVVCDQGPSNQQLYKKDLGITQDKPYFFFEDQKIYCLSDAPHLLKCLRNNFKRYPVMFSHKGLRKIAYWEHIVKCWVKDSQNDHRILPKLTRRHVEVDGLSAMNVRLAAQVLSQSMANALCFMTSMGGLPASGSNTADFCSIVNDLFESVNSRKLKAPQPLLSAVTVSSPHLQSWKLFYDVIASIEFQTQGISSRKVHFPCLQGWLSTLSAFRQMIPELLQRVQFVLMSRFTQDALENFFSQVRQRGGHNDHPTPSDFQARLRILMAQHMLITLGTDANCEPDNDTVLVSMQVLTDTQVQRKKSSHQGDDTTVRDFWSDIPMGAGRISFRGVHPSVTINYSAD